MCTACECFMKNALKYITEEQHEEGKEESENSFQNELCFSGLCLAVSGLAIYIYDRTTATYAPLGAQRTKR